MTATSAARAARRPAATPPVDPALPAMGTLLDADEMAVRLASDLKPGMALERVRIHRVDYRPGRHLGVHYRSSISGRRHDVLATAAVERDLAAEAVSPEARALAEGVRERCPVRHPVRFDADARILVEWFPLDLRLPVLALGDDELSKRLALAVATGLDRGGGRQLLGYVPGRRATLRIGGHVVKAYARADEHERAATGLRTLAGTPGVATAPFVASLPDLRITVQGALAGDEVTRERAPGLFEEAGRLLRALHRRTADALEDAPAAVQLGYAADKAAVVARVVPRLSGRVDRLVERLDATRPADEALVTSHGDFDPSQLLEVAGGIALLDLDKACTAAPAVDAACFAAGMTRPRDGETAGPARRALAGLERGYGAKFPDADWYLATTLLRRSEALFRRLRPGWEAAMEAMVDAACEVAP